MIPVRRHPTRFAVATLAAVVAFIGCAPSIHDDAQFWQALQVSALEVDPPESLQELTDRSTLIVSGKISGVESGPYSLPDEGPTLSTLALVVQIKTSIKGDAGVAEVRVLLDPSSPQDLTNAATPSGEYLLFLQPATQAGYFACTSVAGLVGQTKNGLQTVVDPSQSNLLETAPDGARDNLRDLEPAIRSMSR